MPVLNIVAPRRPAPRRIPLVIHAAIVALLSLAMYSNYVKLLIALGIPPKNDTLARPLHLPPATDILADLPKCENVPQDTVQVVASAATDPEWSRVSGQTRRHKHCPGPEHLDAVAAGEVALLPGSVSAAEARTHAKKITDVLKRCQDDVASALYPQWKNIVFSSPMPASHPAVKKTLHGCYVSFFAQLKVANNVPRTMTTAFEDILALQADALVLVVWRSWAGSGADARIPGGGQWQWWTWIWRGSGAVNG
ncbi:hypothetical protein P153DRAFT_361755 [Dothidotthia symphoricarpi CBS 119687]|uniref:Uncharacterized protein n=1 Tax=Dothidotthia symphoricarpi CBS 119687 TaxID=1392245 RepID=A0A6A5ZW70_9PLEO|nr:uncharacterized protein P153DRAFT_361755 [Dothidotthia symphoricarpi CBS 119687]KAF2123779.1 hypothetical protein P153DRAFT_361755 [Dothidotthia symphoricarpi CBS 119687]